MAPDTDVEIPEVVIEELDQSSDRQLQEIIKYAQQLLNQRHTPTRDLEPRHDNESIVAIEEKGDYILVIVEEDAEPAERTAYHVTYEPGLHHGEGGYHWRYLGPVTK